MLVDSHCHLDRLDLDYFEKNLSDCLSFAREQGVSHFLCVCIDLAHFPNVLAIAERYADVSASVGVHPTEQVPEEARLDELIKLAQHPKVVALGETGLDYYRENTQQALQQQRFREHIRAAIAVNKPLIVHTRQAREDTLRLLKEEGAQQVGGVLHCFTEDLSMAEAAIKENFYISFSGILTFKNATDLKAIAQKLPLERLLIETDAPYLTPQAFRGKPNQPAYVRYVAECLAHVRACSLDQIAEQTTLNFYTLFKHAQNTSVPIN